MCPIIFLIFFVVENLGIILPLWQSKQLGLRAELPMKTVCPVRTHARSPFPNAFPCKTFYRACTARVRFGRPPRNRAFPPGCECRESARLGIAAKSCAGAADGRVVRCPQLVRVGRLY